MCQETRTISTRRVAARLLLATVATALTFAACGNDDGGTSGTSGTSAEQIQAGQEIFRHETFGDEQFWTDVLHMNDVIQSAVDPTTALAVGLKVDSDVLPPGILQTADLHSPATTVALLKLGAVVGLKGTVVNQGGQDQLVRVGITCALCHSTVDDSVQKGIGKRLDGYPNLDLNPGAIIALSPALTAEQKRVYNSWGAGRYDPRYNIDGINAAVLIPPAYGLRNDPHEIATFTGDGDIKYWNDYVAVTQMGGQGSFSDPRIGIDRTLPAGTPDLVAPSLDALREYQLSLATPTPPAGSFDAAAAARGQAVFQQTCARCHQGPNFTEQQLHAPAETGMEPVHASRSATKAYRTTPLRALALHPPYFHDGSAKTLGDVVQHYDTVLGLGLSAASKADLEEYLKSL